MIFARQKYGGISKYFNELLQRIPQKDWELSLLVSNNHYLEETGLKKTLNFFSNVDFKGKERIMVELGVPYSIYKLKSKKWDVFHPTMMPARYSSYMPKNKPMVITAHDVLYYLFHKNNPKREWLLEMDIKAANMADKIIAISENTKRDYIQYFGIDEKKIEVIHHGIEKNKQTIYKNRIEENPYILFVGIRYDYKNFSRFAKAFSIISEKNPEIRLICTGFPFSDSEKNELKSLNIIDKTKLILATEQEMAQLYHDAEMFVFPSTYEGFGMPILEAMVYDCPVVLSNTSCFPEIAQDAGLYFNPYEVDDIVDKITNMLMNVDLRKRYIELGKKRLSGFSWDKCAAEHVKTYNSLL